MSKEPGIFCTRHASRRITITYIKKMCNIWSKLKSKNISQKENFLRKLTKYKLLFVESVTMKKHLISN